MSAADELPSERDADAGTSVSFAGRWHAAQREAAGVPREAEPASPSIESSPVAALSRDPQSAEDRTAADTARLADLLRAGDANAIGAEPALAIAVQVISLADEYFKAAAQRTGDRTNAEPALTEFRELLASTIERGEPLALQPGYQAQLAIPAPEQTLTIIQDRDRER